MRYLLLILIVCAIPAQAGIIIGTGAVAGGPLFSETFDSNLGQFSNVTGTWANNTAGIVASNANGEVMSAAVSMSRGFYVEFDLEQPIAGGIESHITYVHVNASNSISTGNRYSISIGNHYEEVDYADVVIYDNGTVISSENYFTPTDGNRRYRVEFQSGGNIVVKDGATGSTPTNTIATVSDSTHSSFSYLLFQSVGAGSGQEHLIDNVNVGSL